MRRRTTCATLRCQDARYYGHSSERRLLNKPGPMGYVTSGGLHRMRGVLAIGFMLTLATMPAHALVCGDGILDTVLSESCDLGALNGTPGVCCDATCQFVPADTVCRASVGICDVQETCTGADGQCPVDIGAADSDLDGVCDALDDCPLVFDPAQADGDDDGVGDACDFCTNNLPSFADRSRVTIGRLDSPPGDDTLKVKGRCIPFLESPEIDPVVNGLRVVMQDRFDAIVFDVTIPPGEFSTVTRSGWQQHKFPAGITTQYRNAGAVAPLINGIKKVKLVLKNGLGITKFGIRGKGGSYQVAPGAAPIRVTFVVSPPIAANGQCCEMLFTGPEPNPVCSFTANNGTLRCK